MSIQISAESFLGAVHINGLVDHGRLLGLVEELQRRGVDTVNSQAVAEGLGVITRWHADKLLQRKHRGFFLGRYRLLELIGRGRMSCVYLAEHT